MTLKEARILLGWTQQQLEAESGVGQQAISRIETGSTEKVSYETVAKLLRCFQRAGLKGLTADQLFPLPDDQERVS